MQTTDSAYRSLLTDLIRSGDQVITRNARVRRLCVRECTFTSTPLITLRKVAWKNCLREWEWFMSGSNNINDLHPFVQGWWAPWATPNGIIHYNYSDQFRNFCGDQGSYDQMEGFLFGVKNHPFSRRNVLTTWNASDMNTRECPITNCHNTITQAFVSPGGVLGLFTYQRSVDVICGLPHNWLQMWAFLLFLADRTGHKPGWLTWIGGDVHLYEEHYELAKKIIDAPSSPCPDLHHNGTKDDGAFRADDFTLSGDYSPALTESARMVV